MKGESRAAKIYEIEVTEREELEAWISRFNHTIQNKETVELGLFSLAEIKTLISNKQVFKPNYTNRAIDTFARVAGKAIVVNASPWDAPATCWIEV